MAKFTASSLIMVLVGLLILVYVLQGVMPSLIAVAHDNVSENPGGFVNQSVWGAIGSVILQAVWALIVSAGALLLMVKGVMDAFGIGGGKSSYGI